MIDSGRWAEIERLFNDALEIEPTDRVAWVEGQARDSTVRAEVLAMLAADERDAGPFEQRQLGDSTAESTEPAAGGGPPSRTVEIHDPLIGSSFGPYVAEELIGVGGMGRVYRGRRRDGVADRDVAIKVLRPLRTTPDVLRRFKLERALLARLEHPNIAGMIDGGLSREGIPFLVMQYVKGRPLLAYCDENRLDLRTRVELIRTVCSAVEFAHSHLIVHRDLKSSNILVTESGEVKLLDFGIAKLLAPRTLSESLDIELQQTETVTRVATPLYAAPEQLTGDAVTTATDVYSLGVLLYQVLSGRLPYELGTGGRAELERAVVRDPPLRLTTDLVGRSGAGDEVEQLASLRSTTRRELARGLRGDLEKITLKALRKERERRYASAGRLSEDLRRFLEGLPVEAQGDRLTYRLRKFVGRNLFAVSTASLVLVALLVVAVSTTLQARRLAEERDRSDMLAETVVSVIEEGMPGEALSDTIPVEALVDRVEERLAMIEDRPLDQARLLRVLGRIHRSRGRQRQALETFERELELLRASGRVRDEELAELRWEIAQAADESGAVERAPSLYREAIRDLRQAFGDRDRRIFRARKNLTRYLPVAEAEVELQELIGNLEATMTPGERVGDVELARAHYEIGFLYSRVGRATAAARHFDESERLLVNHHAPNGSGPLTVRAGQAMLLDEQPTAQLDELRRLVELREQTFGARTSVVGESRLQLAEKLAWHGKLDEARRELDAADQLLQETIHADARLFGRLALERGVVLRRHGEFDRSVVELERAADILWEPVDVAHARAQAALSFSLIEPERAADQLLAAEGELAEAHDPAFGVDWRVARARFALLHGYLRVGGEADARRMLATLEACASWDKQPSWFRPALDLAIPLASRVDLEGTEIASRLERYRTSAGRDETFLELAERRLNSP